jgi:hypothetical protein
MSRPQDKENVRKLLDGLSEATVREMCIAALRDWHRAMPQETDISMHGVLGRALVPRLLAHRQQTATPDEQSQLKEPFIDAQHEPWMAAVTEFIWWFIGAGFGAPVNLINNNVIYMRLMRRGAAFLDGGDDHPLLPGFTDRARSRCPNLPGDVTALLVDAVTCIDRMLLRPAIVLMGVAFEVAIEAVAQSLVTRNVLPATVMDQSAARRISTIRGVIDAVLPGTSAQERDERYTVQRAYNFADDLRRRRNDASHTAPTYGFDDRPETEELLVSAGRLLPAPWRLTRV